MIKKLWATDKTGGRGLATQVFPNICFTIILEIIMIIIRVTIHMFSIYELCARVPTGHYKMFINLKYKKHMRSTR